MKRMTKLFILLVTILSLLYIAKAATVMGIDFGSDSVKAAVIKGTTFEVVINKESKRKTLNAVGFTKSGERVFGNRAESLLSKSDDRVVKFGAELLGKHYGDPTIEAKKEFYPFELRKIEGRETYGVAFKNKTGETVFTIEELVGMILEHVKEAAEAFSEASVKDCVVTVPPYWTHHERKALVAAAKLAKLNVLTVINEPTAVALQYAISRKLEDTENVLFFDMGESTTKASIVTFTKFLDEKNKTVPQLQVLATKWDRSIGARDFDRALLNHFADMINADKSSHQYTDGEIRKYKRAMGKLYKETKRVKEILSANSETFAQVEGLVGEYDFKASINRDTFEKLNANNWPKLAQLAKEVLQEAEMKVNDLTAFELVGGGVRMPKAYETLREFYGKESLDRHLNGDEAACQGAAYYGVIKSIAFKTQNIKVRDVNLLPVQIKVLSGLEAEPKLLFNTETMFDHKKVLTFRTSNETSLQIEYDQPNLLPSSSSSPLIAQYNITGFPADGEYNYTTTPRVSVTFVLQNGFVFVEKAELQFKYATTEKVTKKVKLEDKKTDEKKTDEKKEDKKEEKKDLKEEKNEKNQTKPEEKYEEVVVYKPVNKTKKINLKVSEKSLGILDFTEEQYKEIKQRYQAIQEAEEIRIKTLKALNELESYSYSISDLTSEQNFVDFSTSFERSQLKEMAESNLEWLEDEGANAVLKDLQSRLRNMTREVDRVKHRISESKAFPEAIRACRSLINMTSLLMENITERLEVTEEEYNDTINEANRLNAYLDEKVKEREALKEYDDPITSASSVDARCSILSSMTRRLFNRKKRMPKKVDLKSKNNSTSNSTETNESENVKNDSKGTSNDEKKENAKKGENKENEKQKKGEKKKDKTEEENENDIEIESDDKNEEKTEDIFN